MKPIIGISVDCHQDVADARTGGKLELNWNYTQAIADAGGVPLLVPPTADMSVVAELIDGWLIPGGLDIDAKHFGEENHPSVGLQDPARFEAEGRLYRAAHPEMPVLGICYGCQFLNVMRGGNLHQHLPDVPGSDVHTGGVLQAYDVVPDSSLGHIIGDAAISGKSYHHQAVNQPGDRLSIVARSGDGTIEALEDPDHPWFVGLQWHPERTALDSKTQRVFQSFVQAAGAFKASRNKSAVSA